MSSFGDSRAIELVFDRSVRERALEQMNRELGEADHRCTVYLDTDDGE